MTAVVAVECLYGSWHTENLDGYIVLEVVEFPIIKKTRKRIFYDAGYGRTRTVDREQLETTGTAFNRSQGAWAPDYQLFANRADAEPAPAETPAEKVSRMRAAMADAHPDRGGSAEAFRAARERYLRAKGVAA